MNEIQKLNSQTLKTRIRHLFFSFLILSTFKQAIEEVPLSWAFCENCLSVRVLYAGEFFHSMVAVLAQWEPLCS